MERYPSDIGIDSTILAQTGIHNTLLLKARIDPRRAAVGQI